MADTSTWWRGVNLLTFENTVLMMEEFCGGKTFWDTNLTWGDDRPFPEFTECFQDTVLVWIPCIWVGLTLPFYLTHILRQKDRKPVPYKSWNLSKMILAFLHVSVCMREYYRRTDSQEGQLWLAYNTAPVLEGIALMVVLMLMEMTRRKGFVTSGVLFIYWALATVCKFIPFLTRALHEGLDDSLRSFMMFNAPFFVTLVQLVMTCYADEVEIPKGEGAEPSPEPYASFISSVTVSWVQGLIMKGYQNPLEERDIYDLNPRDKSSTVVPKFEENWEKEKQRAMRLLKEKTSKETQKNDSDGPSQAKEPQRPKVSLARVLIRTFGLSVLASNLSNLADDIVDFMKPLMLKLLIDYIEGEDVANWKGYLLAFGLLVLTIFSLVTIETRSLVSHQLSHRVRAALVAAINKKSMTMSNKARKESTVGEIVNIMSKDSEHLSRFCCYSWGVWSSPLHMIVSVVGLYSVVGNAMFAGLAIIVILMPIKTIIDRKRRALHKEEMETSDKRTKLITEVINGIKILKLYAWEMAFGKKVTEIRDQERKISQKNESLGILDNFCWTLAPFIIGMVTLGSYVYMQEDHRLTAQTAFVAISFLDILRGAVNMVPIFVLEVLKASISIKRVNDFLNNEDLDESNVTHKRSDEAVTVEDGTFSWNKEEKNTLKNINFRVPKGSLVAVVGQVGVGKSSLVSAVLGEMEKISGTVNVDGSLAYVSQQAWIQNATVRDNILFGKTMKQSKFQKVIDACALKSDLNVFKAGDMTEIGEKGINLSGGQKQRISLARAVYHNSDIYLLDDPLSAVDSHVGKHIFEHVIGSDGLLKNKTRILVTHGVQWLPHVDTIVVMVDGMISEVGSYQQLLDHDGAFAQFLRTYAGDNKDENGGELEAGQVKNNQMENISDDLIDHVDVGLRRRLRVRGLSESERHSNVCSKSCLKRVLSVDEYQTTIKTMKKKIDQDIEDRVDHSFKKSFLRSISQDDSHAVSRALSVFENEPDTELDSDILDKIIDDENLETGKVSWSVIGMYFKAFGVLSTAMMFILFTMTHCSHVVSSLWMTRWTNDSDLHNLSILAANSTERRDLNNFYMMVYALTGVMQAVLTAANLMIWIYGTSRASRIIHENMLTNVLRSPMSFFDSTPVGRIVSRFTHDMGTCDGPVPHQARGFFHCIIHYISTVLVILYTTPAFIFALVPIAVIYYFIQNFFAPTYCQLRRISSKTRSPIFSGFSESLAGVETIRAFGVQERFIRDSAKRLDRNNRCNSATLAVSIWLAVRIRALGAVIVFAAAILTVLGKDHMSAAMAGLTITYAMMFTDTLQWLVRVSSELESNIVSLEKIKAFTYQPTEAPLVKEKRPSPAWPEKGHLELKNLAVRYREGQDLIVKGIDLDVKPGEKVGIVGRTAAGKSTLTISLFRLLEAAEGSIFIDGEDISQFGLADVRSRLTILPQEPVLLSGSLRMNLDPLSEHTDTELLVALEHAHLKSFVDSLSNGLDYEVGEGGQNLSVGQRQLICLARSLLKNTKVLILDEATAAVDMETDELIQNTIRREFSDCTFLTIAHRLNTIIDYDRILVLEKGRVKEFDTPKNLLQDKTSEFYQMAKDAGLV